MQNLLLPRDPDAPQRTRAFIDVAGTILNSLILGGVFRQAGPETWGVAGLLFVGTGPPAGTLATVGDFYLDLGSGILYQKS